MKKPMQNTLRTSLSLATLCVALAACGGGGGEESSKSTGNEQIPASNTSNETATPAPQESSAEQSQEPQLKTGILIDSPMANVGYTTSSGRKGRTDTQGQFFYETGDSVVFSLGSIQFTAVAGAPVITPLDLFGTTDLNENSVINALRLFQSLDDDGNVDTEITFSNLTISAINAADLRIEDFELPSEEFQALPSIQHILANGEVATTELVAAERALAHFAQYATNAANLDSDHDGILNSVDADDDNDGLPDISDTSPLGELSNAVADSGQPSNSGFTDTKDTLPTADSTATVVELTSPSQPNQSTQEPEVEVTDNQSDSPQVTTEEEVTDTQSGSPQVTTEEETVSDELPVDNSLITQEEETVTNENPVLVDNEDPTKYAATLSWATPDTRENGDTLANNEIGGFEIKYRSVDDASYMTITVQGADVHEYTLGNLNPGTYEFMIATFDADGVYSQFSEPLLYTLGS